MSDKPKRKREGMITAFGGLLLPENQLLPPEAVSLETNTEEQNMNKQNPFLKKGLVQPSNQIPPPRQSEGGKPQVGNIIPTNQLPPPPPPSDKKTG